jgi:hypothetical protein
MNFLNSNIYLAFGIHQMMGGMNELPITHLIIPEAALSVAPAKPNAPHVTPIFGVPTDNPTLQELELAYKNWNISDKPALDHKWIIVMLPGDAPDTDGKMAYFTPESATDLFLRMQELWARLGKVHGVLIHNGPRTGKYDLRTGSVKCTYRGDIDDVSKHFLELMKQSKIKHHFYPFEFLPSGTSIVGKSVYNPLLYLATQGKNNYFLIPGESVSFLTQVPLYVRPERGIVFFPSSINPVHHAVFEKAFEKGYLSYFSQNGAVIQPSKPQQRHDTDTIMVVKALMDGYAEGIKVSEPQEEPSTCEIRPL